MKKCFMLALVLSYFLAPALLASELPSSDFPSDGIVQSKALGDDLSKQEHVDPTPEIGLTCDNQRVEPASILGIETGIGLTCGSCSSQADCIFQCAVDCGIAGPKAGCSGGTCYCLFTPL